MNTDHSDFEPSEWDEIVYTLTIVQPDFVASFTEAKARALLVRLWQAVHYDGKLTPDEFQWLTGFKNCGAWDALNNREPYLQMRVERQHPQRVNYWRK